MWETLKEFGKVVGRKLGLIESLNKLSDHKSIRVNEEAYSRIEKNKALYKGYYKEWHFLKYLSTNGTTIEREQMTMGMPKILAEKFASLVFNEGVSISIEDESIWKYVKPVVESNKFKRDFQRYLEYMFAFGGLAIEVYLDDIPKLAWAEAGAFFPLTTDTEEIDEAVIANVFHEDGKVYTLLKWHEWIADEQYRIKNELYESNSSDKIGDKVRLSKLFPDMEEEILFTGISRPLFVYLKPNIANNFDITSPLGIGVFENAYDTIRMLDVMYDFWYNEFRLGKRRVAVPHYLVKTGYQANGQPFNYFDDSEELFVAMNSGEMDDMQMKDLTVDLRVDQVIHSINALLDILSMQVGLSSGTFTFTPQGVKTATQVMSENSQTFRTRSSHLLIIEDALRDLIVTIYEVATMGVNGTKELNRDDISIDFNDGIFTDSQSMLDFYSQAVNHGLAPKREAIKRIFGLSEQEADAWLQRINIENLSGNVDVDEVIKDITLNGVLDNGIVD